MAGVRSLPALARINLALLGAAVLALTLYLWPEWQQNPDLSHGFFMPLIFLLLLHESRSGTPRFLPAHPLTTTAFALLLLGSLAALVAAGLYAAAVDWSHAIVDLMLSAAVALVLAAAVVAFSTETRRLLPFNWSALMAAVLWLLATPLPPGTYTRLTLTLQLWVSEGVLRALHLLGIAAVRHGNVIDLANTSVGVEEACSGVRSLISCVFAGLFFSATLVRGPWARGLIIALAAPLALAMNFLRSLGLTLLANAGVDIEGTWHDVTGFAVLGVTAALLCGLALLLDRGAKPQATRVAPASAPVNAAPAQPAAPRPKSALDVVLTGGLATATALAVFFVANTRATPASSKPAPELFSLLPASAEGWQVKSSDLYEFRGALQTEHLAQRHYIRTTAAGPLEIILYVAYWPAGQAPVSLVASHTPDACWPGSGWTPITVEHPRIALAADGRTLPEAEHRMFRGTSRPQHVWFWHLYNGQPLGYRKPSSPLELLSFAARYGFRHSGDQMFVRVSSNRPWSEIAREPLVAEFFRRIHPLGL
jgi:exosortase